MAGKPYDSIKTNPPTTAISSIDYIANFKQFLKDRNTDNQSWCFWYGGFEPHRAYEYESGRLKANKKLTDIEAVPPFFPDNEQVRNDLLDYAMEIEYFDKQLAQMMAHLEAIGELENTIIVVTADNGMPFPRIKGQKYELSNHLPLAIRWPKGIQNPGRQIDDYVNFIDFAPTFLEIAGIKESDSGMAAITGRSLSDIFNSTQSGIVNKERDHILLGKERHDVGRPNDGGYPVRAIVKDNYLYIHNYETERWPGGNPSTGYLNCDGSPTKTEILELRRSGVDTSFWSMAFGKRPKEEVYNLQQDAYCMVNLATNPEYEVIKKDLQNQLFAELENEKDPRLLGNAAIFDSYLYTDTSSVNFYERFHSGEQLKAGWVSPSDFESDFE